MGGRPSQGWGTDEEALIKVLANKQPEQIEELKAAYQVWRASMQIWPGGLGCDAVAG